MGVKLNTILNNPNWDFTVKAKRVQAIRDIVNCVGLAVLVIASFAWTGHVAKMRLPHDSRTETLFGPMKNVVEHCGTAGSACVGAIFTEEVIGRKEVDTGLSTIGQWYFGSAIVTLILGIILLGFAYGGVVEAIADLKTTEYNAYRSILYDIKD